MRTATGVLHARIAACCILATVATACGQKAGVHQEAPLAQATAPEVQASVRPAEDNAAAPRPDASDASAPSTDASRTPAPGEGQPFEPGEVTSGAPADGAPGATGSAGDSTADAPGDAPAAAPGRSPVTGSDRTGVSDTTITLAAHAPVTGAAPLPNTVFEESADLYWRWLRDVEGKDVLGRQIELIFQDDRYTPSTARQVCRQLMQVGFLLSGVGADGIAASAPLAEQLHVPYIAFGADEGALAGNPWYFSSSATYPAQGDLWSQYLAANRPGEKASAIAIDTSNWDASVAAWEAGLRQRGVDHAPALRHPREGTDWYAPFARALADEGVQVVLMYSSPLHIIRFAQVARDQGFDFHYLIIAPGGLNAILENGCPALANSTSFSAWPSLDVVDQVDPEFRQAVQRYGISNENLDLSLALWGASRFAYEMFLEYERRYGTDLTREDFRDMVETMTVSTGLFPDQGYTPSNHFGTQPGVHVLLADCPRELWADGGTFLTGF